MADALKMEEKEKEKNHIWHLTRDTLHVTYDTWHVTHGGMVRWNSFSFFVSNSFMAAKYVFVWALSRYLILVMVLELN